MVKSNKKQKHKILKSPAFWLLLGAIAIEIVNVLVTFTLGAAQQDVCHKSDFPRDLSVFLGVLSLILMTAVLFVSKNKIFALALLLFWLIVVVVTWYFLQFLAVGGLDWCNFLGR